MEEQTKKRFYKRWWFWVLAVLVLGVISYSGNKTNVPQTGVEPEVTTSSFSALSRARFDDILKSAPELQAINCIDSDCRDVVYFDYKTVPNDLEFVIRGNAATFSKFKMDNTGVSNVTVIARLDGRELIACTAAQGRVKECQ